MKSPSFRLDPDNTFRYHTKPEDFHRTGMDNSDGSKPWHKIVYGLPLGHCEGVDHLDRVDLLIRLRQEIAGQAPAQLLPTYESLVKQARDVRSIIASFGRHPHRNTLLDRRTEFFHYWLVRSGCAFEISSHARPMICAAIHVNNARRYADTSAMPKFVCAA